MSEQQGMNGPQFMEFIEELRKVMKPTFDAQHETWEREGPAAMDRLTATGAVIDSIGGNCPVQAYGTIGGKRFYFRARGDEWQFHVAETDDDIFDNPIFYREEEYGSGFDAGWMPHHEAIGFIVECIAQFRATQQPAAGQGESA